jgi:sugar transferase (PEP-CTERM/EpsH1 system associated)
MLDFLAKRVDVHLATLADEPVSSDTLDELNKRCKRVAIEKLGAARWVRGGSRLLRGRSATEGLFWSPRLYRTVRDWTSQVRFDAVVVYCSSVVQYLACPGLRNVPAIVDLVDVDSQKWQDYAAQTCGVRRFLFNLEGRRTRRLEEEACRRADSVLLVSNAEADLFRSICPNDHTYAMPNGVDLDYFPFFRTEGIPGRCAFVGALDYRANVDGICWFCGEVWPQVRAALPSATLDIVGRNPAPEVIRLRSVPGVEVHASVPDVRPYLAQASVVVAPLRIARGIQNKVLEAMACGRAVISSREAAEGLAVVPERDLRIATSAESWVCSIVDLLVNRSCRLALAAEGRRFVETQHHWESSLRMLDRLMPHQLADRVASGLVPMLPISSVQGSGTQSNECLVAAHAD